MSAMVGRIVIGVTAEGEGDGAATMGMTTPSGVAAVVTLMTIDSGDSSNSPPAAAAGKAVDEAGAGEVDEAGAGMTTGIMVYEGAEVFVGSRAPVEGDGEG